MAGNAIKAFRAKGQAKKAAKRRATTDLPHGARKVSSKSSSTREAFLAEHLGAGSLAGFYKAKKSKREHKRLSHIGLGRTKKGRTPRSPGVPFERGRIGLRKKTRKSNRSSGRK